MAHINVIEIKAIYFGLTSLHVVQNTYIIISTDNITRMAYIKNMGRGGDKRNWKISSFRKCTPGLGHKKIITG